MPRRPDTPCARCGTLLWGGTASLPAGERTCRPCRRQEPRPNGCRTPGRERDPRTCAWCGETFTPKPAARPGQKACSVSCGQRLHHYAADVALRCSECDDTFFSSKRVARGANRYCGPVCKERGKRRLKKETGRLSDSSARARARKYGTKLETVEARRVFERDRWICQLCGRKINRMVSAPHPMSASLDHILPISRGGDHTYANTQLAHLRCNIAKGNRGSGQLALIG